MVVESDVRVPGKARHLERRARLRVEVAQAGRDEPELELLPHVARRAALLEDDEPGAAELDADEGLTAERLDEDHGPAQRADQALAPEVPPDRQLKGVLVLREPLGSEIVAHFDVDARPAVTEDIRELARDVGQEGGVPSVGEGPAKTTMVGRFGPRSRVRNGDVVNVAVDTGSVHVFDAESGDAIYAQDPAPRRKDPNPGTGRS